MRKILVLLFAFTMLSDAKAQDNYNYSEAFTGCFFEDVIDSLNSSESGIWQIAHPDKTTLNSSASGYQCIVTDSVNSYPVLDSSQFYYGCMENGGFYYHHTFSMSGAYWVQTDSLNDFGTIELRLPRNPEYGWIDLLNDSLPDFSGSMRFIDDYVNWNWNEDKPVLTGNSNGWLYFEADMLGLDQVMNFSIEGGDTLLFRFRFHSDNNLDTMDGLAFDDITLCNYVEGIDEYLEDWVSISPNPFSNEIFLSIIDNQSTPTTYKVLNALGEMVLNGKIIESNPSIDLNQLNTGVYFIEFFDQRTLKKGRSKIIKQ